MVYSTGEVRLYMAVNSHIVADIQMSHYFVSIDTIYLITY